MLGENTSENKHLASLDFNISGILPQMQEVERIVRETGLSLKQVVESNFNIGEAINKQIQTSAGAFSTTGMSTNLENSVKRVGMSLKKATELMIQENDPNALLAKYLRNGGKKTIIGWNEAMEKEMKHSAPDLKKSLSSYVKWDNTGKSAGIDVFRSEIEELGITTSHIGNEYELMLDVYERINQFRNKRNYMASGEMYEDEVKGLMKYRYSLSETEDELRDFLIAQEQTKRITTDFTGTQLGNLGSADLDARIAKIREVAGVEEQLKISTDEEGNIRRAVVDYTDQQGRKIRETINLTNELNNETGEMESRVKNTNFDYIDQSLKRANDELKQLHTNFKAYADLKKQSETKNMLPKEQDVVQERLTRATKEYQESLVKVVQYGNQGLITQEQYIQIAEKEKMLQDDILITKEKQAQADNEKYQAIAKQFEKEQSMLQQNLSKNANNVQKDGLDEQHLVNIRKIQVELEQLGRESSVITQDELTQLDILRRQSEAIEQQVLQEKRKSELAKKTEQDEKNILSVYERSAKLQAQIKMSKATGSQALSRETSLIRQQAEQLFKRLSTDGKITDEMKQQTAELSKQLNLLETQAKVNISSNPKVNNKGMLGEIASKAKWYVAGSAAFAGGYVAKQALQTLTDVEYKVMEITRVMNDSTLNVQSFQEELFNLAVGYGRSFDDVSEVALRFAQAGYSVKDTISMTKDSLLALNTAELDVENSTQSMIGIMQQWGYEATELSTIIDKINYTADNNPITSQDLVDGLLQAGAAAKTAKISFDDTIGTLTAMKEASGRTGREVGNAFKSIIAYTQRDKSFDTFESLGIKVFADEAKTMLRPTLDTIGDLSAKFKENGNIVVDTLLKDEGAAELLNESMAELIGSSENYSAIKQAESDATNQSLTDMERLDAVQTAGMHRRTYFISLLENFNKIQEVSTALQNAEGYSLTENAKHMETLKAKVVQLVESLKQLAVQAGEAGLMNIAKGAVDAATAIMDITSNMGGLVPALTLVLGVVIALKREKIASELVGLGNNIKGLGKGFKTIQAEAATAGTTVSTAGAKMQAAFGWIGLALATITLIVGAISAHNKKLEEQRQKTIDAGLAANETIKSVTTLKDKYDELAKTSSKTTEQEEEFKKVQEELISLLGDKADVLKNLTAGTDAYREALTKATAEEIESQRLALERSKQASKEQVNSLFTGAINTGKSAIDITTGGKSQGILDKHLGEFRGIFSDENATQYGPQQDNYESQIEWYKKLKLALDDLTKDGDFESFAYKKVNSEVSRLSETMEEAIKIQGTLDIKTAQQNETLVKTAISTAKVSGATVTNNEELEKFNKTVVDSIAKSGGFEGSIEDIAIQVKQLSTKEFPNLNKAFKSTGDAVVDLSNATKSNETILADFNKVVDESQEKLQELADLHDLVANSEEVSGSQILDLIQKYPQYATEIANVNTNKQAMIDITKSLFEVEKKAAVAKLNADKQQLTSDSNTIISTLNVARAKITAMQATAMLDSALAKELDKTKASISGLEKELSKTKSNISAMDNAIATINNMDISNYSSKSKGAKSATDKQTEAVNKQIEAFEHLNSMGVYTLQQQIDFYKELLRTTKNTVETQQKLETTLFNLYKKQVQEKIQLAEKEKNKRIKAIQDTADKEIKALQKVQDERESSRNAEDYQDNRGDILEQISYWEQRTGNEAVTNLKDLKEQLADVDKDYQRKQEDEKLAKQIEAIEERRDREIEAVEKVWEEIQNAFDSENLDMVNKAKLYSSDMFKEYNMNFLKPFLDDISKIKDAMRQIANSSKTSISKTVKVPTPTYKQAYASGTINAKGNSFSKVGEYGPELRVLNQGDGIVPAQATKNLMEIGQYSLNQIMDKVQFTISSALQSRLSSDIQRLQQNYNNSTSNNYNNASNDNSRSTVVTNNIINNNHIEDETDGQALANLVGRQLLSQMKSLPRGR